MCFGEYGVAMERKLAIAEYHLEELRHASTDPDEEGLPPIPLQAHFEAAGRAIASMPDQLATGIVEPLQSVVPGLPPPTAAYLHTVIDSLPVGDLRAVLEQLTDDDRYSDLRLWRNRATHRFDRKAARNGIWIVAPPSEGDLYVEPRDVTGYVETMLDYGHWMWGMAPEIEDLTLQLKAP